MGARHGRRVEVLFRGPSPPKGVRPGLVVVGGLLIVLAVAAIAVVTFTPGGTNQTSTAITIPVHDLLPNATNFALIPGTNASAAIFSLTWTATIPTDVRLYDAPGCRAAALSCATGPPVRAWSAELGGTWSTSGDVGFPYLIEWNTSAPGVGTWGLTGSESISTPMHTGLLESLVIYAAGGALAIVGAVALFLGLFLRGGVYQSTAPMVSRSADDAVEVARDAGPPPKRPG